MGKRKIYFIIILAILFIIIFNCKNTYGFKQVKLYDANKEHPGEHIETVPEAGDGIKIPSSIPQSSSQVGGNPILGGTIRQKWEAQGSPRDKNNWCYLNVGGTKRYFVALAPIYGLTGDYVDIYINNNGTEKVYPCIITNSKDVWEAFEGEHPYVYNGKKYGHLVDNLCNIMEICVIPYSIPEELTKSLKNVTKIVNGGNISDSPNGPVGLDKDINYASTASVGSQQEWLNTLEKWTNEMLSDGGWIYSNSKNKTNYLEAKKTSPRRSNCALMVVHALQYFGAFDKDMKFYGNSKGGITANAKTKARLSEIAEIKDFDVGTMTTSKATFLEPGDILLYPGHTNVYKGTDSNGNKLWYDAGRCSTADIAAGSKFVTFSRKANEIGMSVTHVIRLKYNSNIDSLNSESSEFSEANDETKNFWGIIGSWFREGWAALSALFDNQFDDKKSASALYAYKKVDDIDSGEGNGDILASCEAVTKIMLNRGCRYSLGPGLVWKNIKFQFEKSNRFCCATYVAMVLYYAGVLSESQINAYNYHWTGDGGIPDMLKNAGWTKLDASQAQPGDVINDFTVHAMIYAGNGKVWDQTSCVISSSGTPPTGTTRSRSITGCQVWRAPSSF